jgi:hypothetical protein
MANLRTLQRQAAERLGLAKQLLQQRASMQRCDLSEVEYLCFRTGCSVHEAEQLVAQLSAEKRCDIPTAAERATGRGLKLKIHRWPRPVKAGDRCYCSERIADDPLVKALA